jgi:hypothetical protein
MGCMNPYKADVAIMWSAIVHSAFVFCSRSPRVTKLAASVADYKCHSSQVRGEANQ